MVCPAGSASRTVTQWPSRPSMVAVHNPITPPPQIRTLLILSPPSCPSWADRRSGAEIVIVSRRRQHRASKSQFETTTPTPAGTGYSRHRSMWRTGGSKLSSALPSGPDVKVTSYWSVMGQNRKSSLRANVFRCSPNNGHREDTSACPFRASKRLLRCSIALPYSITSSARASREVGTVNPAHQHRCAAPLRVSSVTNAPSDYLSGFRSQRLRR
jgi:hypothetical protein